ncbi:peptidase M13, partial [Pseudomonas sp. FW306-02-F08-AA]
MFADLLSSVAALTSVTELIELVGRFERDGISGLFNFYVDTDPAQPDTYTVNLMQGGLGLPDESFYTDEQYAAIREAYV